MFRDASEELARLEAELLAEEMPEEPAEEELLPEEEEEDILPLYEDTRPAQGRVVYQNYSNHYGADLRNYASGYRAYNSDISDEDLDSYAEEVRQGRKSGSNTGLLIATSLLTLGIVGVLLYWLLVLKNYL